MPAEVLRLLPIGGPGKPKPEYSEAEALISLTFDINKAFVEGKGSTLDELRPSYEKAQRTWGWSSWRTVKRFIGHFGPRLVALQKSAKNVQGKVQGEVQGSSARKQKASSEHVQGEVQGEVQGICNNKHSQEEITLVEQARQIVEDLNRETGKNFLPTSRATMRLVSARLKDGFTFEAFQKVHRVKAAQWKSDAEMNRYLRPETLYGSKFEAYLNEAPVVSPVPAPVDYVKPPEGWAP